MSDAPRRAAPRSHLTSAAFAAVAVLLLAANMRAAVNVVGVVMPEMRATLGLSGLAVGLLVALPQFCFAVIGATGPSIVRKIGLSRTALLAIVALTVGQLIRSLLPGVGWLFAGSVIAMAAIAFTNVIMPSLVRHFFPARIAAMTAAYTVVMGVTAASVAFLTIPLQRAMGGSYLLGLGMWAVLSAIAIIPWLAALREPPQPVRAGESRLRMLDVGRTGHGWWIAVLFGVQSLQAYVSFGLFPVMLTDGGMSDAAAGVAIGVLIIASSVGGLLTPVTLSRLRRPATLPWVLTTFYLLGYLGLLLGPRSLTMVWTALLGLGGSYFPFALYVVNLRARTHQGVLTLSAFMQSVGYLIAGSTLTTIGAIHGDSTDWTWVILAMLTVCVVQHVAALVCVRPWFIEDSLPRGSIEMSR